MSLCPESNTCFHELAGGRGGCGGTALEVHYTQYVDGCWISRIRHPFASHTHQGHGSKRNIWWIADANNKPHWCFASYDFTLALQIKEAALEILSSIPMPKLPPTNEELLEQLAVAQLKINALEKQLKGKRR